MYRIKPHEQQINIIFECTYTYKPSFFPHWVAIVFASYVDELVEVYHKNILNIVCTYFQIR